MSVKVKNNRHILSSKYVIVIFVVLVICAIVWSSICKLPAKSVTDAALSTLKWRIEKYIEDKDELPLSLAILPERQGYYSSIKDGWGREIIYKHDSDGNITLMSFGRDGKPGGLGEDSNISKTFNFLLVNGE